MSSTLSRNAEVANNLLKSLGITDMPTIRVGIMMNLSASMRGAYYSGHVQEILNRVLGLAMNFDPQHCLDVFVFDETWAQLPEPITTRNYTSYVEQYILTENVIPPWGKSCCSPVLNGFQDHFFGQEARRMVGLGGILRRWLHKASSPSGSEWASPPVLGIVITDEEITDRKETEETIRQASSIPVFWSLVGVGTGDFLGLKEMAQKFNDVEFVDLEHFQLEDKELYEQLVSTKLTRWLMNHQQASLDLSRASPVHY